jgi:hypothetical protein
LKLPPSISRNDRHQRHSHERIRVHFIDRDWPAQNESNFGKSMTLF